MDTLRVVVAFLSQPWMDYVWLGACILFLAYCVRYNRRHQGLGAPRRAMLDDSSAARTDGPPILMERRHEDYRSPNDSWDHSATVVNPASGQIMVGGIGGLDTAGNPYGTNNNGTS